MPSLAHPRATEPVAVQRSGAAPREGALRVGLVVNARARGLAERQDGASAFAVALEDHGFALATPPKPDLPLEEQLAAILGADPDAVIVAGGDGTVSAVARSLAETGIPIGILPCGTMNRLACRLGLPDDPIAAVESLSTAKRAALTVGTVNGRIFLYQSLIGRPARLARLRELQRKPGENWLKLLVGALRALGRPLRRRRIRLIGPDGWRRDAVAAVVTVPGPQEDGGLRADAVTRSGVMMGALQAWRWFRGRFGEAPAVERVILPRLSVLSRTGHLRLTLDGEMCLMPPPLQFEVAHETCHVLVPGRAA
ncbi:diacylglycerol/lipid kinase family protein [Elioraea rosea]|uniref:diacylglycerol/lipid kinase family protein n=1 Tax=Elioraea rosea TaxID=2492390 RepID=UPI00118252AD|nr:diacylglycerol kinase family protein [Elioraea rosea]